jgi:hypothetical protein
VVVFTHELADPPRRRPHSQRIGEFSVSGDSAGGDLREELRQFRDQIGNLKSTIH